MDAEVVRFVEKVNTKKFRDGMSRRGFLGGLLATAGGAAGLAMMPRSAHAEATSTAGSGNAVTEILNTAITAEALAVTYLGAVINGAGGLTPVETSVLQAARAEEYAHYQFLKGAGATPQTLTFYVPNTAMVTDRITALETIAAAEGLFINAYLSAIATFSAKGMHSLAVYAASILGTECEHRSLARAALTLEGVTGYAPPNNLDFEQATLPSVAAVASQLKSLGFFGPGGVKAPFDASGIVSSGVSGSTPPQLDPSANQAHR